MYRCSLIPYAVRSALRTEHVRSLRNGISLKMAKYPVKSTSQSTYGRMERTLSKFVSLGPEGPPGQKLNSHRMDAQDCGISKAVKDTSMLPSEIDQMKVSQETGSEANIEFGRALMPSYLEMCPP
ncbi:hypothetical protein DPX16_6288 [Anabarilius grahami]|uniref:Uncharacterized protein n=1 Tax=Anabarilius grahami TaxID=495550 RepID=A0A3N0YJF5_ANAGA|nr:hypothetical protein DPX16_6288 [Anabarilius grahami]